MNSPEPQVIRMYEARREIYPREAKGRYASLRWLCVWLTQLAFYGLPWLTWNGRQAVLFDLGTRKFYLFGLVLWPQDFIYLAALLIISAWLLFLVTAVAGRVWCGFACPQTVYTEIFLWIERKIEGSRSVRMALDRQGPSVKKSARKLAKHLAWGAVALWTGFTFVGYFTPILDLGAASFTLAFGPWEWFWVLFYALATYGNAGWLREQVCKYMCPYARFQSSMFDRDTLIVTYDAKRGEPRGKKGKGEGKGDGAGSCIDCTMCVQVCPTGIDIRNGLQYECIGCAACVDACNVVMDKVGQPRGLIRYSTDRALAEGLDTKAIRRRAMRPRVLVYCTGLLVVVLAVGTALALRTPLKMDVLRDRGSMGREVDGGAIENVYRLQIMNTTEQAHRYRITAHGLPGLTLATADEVSLASTETRAVPIRLRVPHGAGTPGSNRITVTLVALDDAALTVTETAVFIVPH
ncbi:cytochrome c oxidase accessory protein CcoG [Pseudoduganella buxea]|uniref:Cytochrome c oxidase accessory protein CcoG n=1 Tax=Pseudoduganella buxea TaxID=1949069 RepID=A0A6I3STI4_9BURK|nr:cytochrome c oxidase accessory protein CcoG [Pseudoduganella buxea]MTV52458.1 cytochrome c oxidase accessory protein CcoG [Pseudoduganella buxea]GGC18327.1 ferredoxin [Pseudoduganella buxea]